MSNFGKRASLSSPAPGADFPGEGRGKIHGNPAFLVLRHGFISGFEILEGFSFGF